MSVTRAVISKAQKRSWLFASGRQTSSAAERSPETVSRGDVITPRETPRDVGRRSYVYAFRTSGAMAATRRCVLEVVDFIVLSSLIYRS